MTNSQECVNILLLLFFFKNFKQPGNLKKGNSGRYSIPGPFATHLCVLFGSLPKNIEYRLTTVQVVT